MLEQKWSKTDGNGNAVVRERSGTGWEESLRHRWAVVKLARAADAEDKLGAPAIERLPEQRRTDEGPKRSVNELLSEMRLTDANGGEDASANRDGKVTNSQG